MVQASRTFRVFVSSTFDDLKAERNALQERVFPRLKALCAERGTRFQAIDLRWGVSEEAGRDQQTMAICLDEVVRCQKASPKPNFIILLGDRYGWCPLPSSIDSSEFEEILTKVPDAKTLLLFDEAKPEEGNGWYRRDDNAVSVMDDDAAPVRDDEVPVAYRLRERTVAVPEGASDEQRQAANDKEEASWGRDEGAMRDALRRAIDALGWAKDDERRIKYEASATEQEILDGALSVADAHEHVFGFFRKILNRDDLIAAIPAEPPTGEADPNLPPAEKFIDLTVDRVPDEKARRRLDTLKHRLDDHLPGNIRQYGARWEGDRISREHLDQLCEDVYEALAGVITAELEQIEEIREKRQLGKEIEDHERFAEDRVGTRFVGRLEPLHRIKNYLTSGDNHPLAVFGASGSGKSALMAAAGREARERAGDAVIVRFIGATPESSIGRSLLFSLCRQIARRYADDGLASTGGEEGEQQSPRTEEDIPADYRELSAEFSKQLARATEGGPLVIFLDALDQLSAADGARGLSWLPRELPEHASIIVSTSTSPADCLEALRAKLPMDSFEELAPMGREEGEELLGVWLGQAGRRLRRDQMDYVLDRFAGASVGDGKEEQQGGLPLYLKLVFEEARRWRSHEGVPELLPTIRGVIRDNLFARLSTEAHHGGVLVRHALGYLGAAKNGLTEDEMLDVLSGDAEVLADFRRRSPKSPEVASLPVAVWSRLYFDLEAYLTERSADDTSLMGFYHRQLGEVVEEDYLAADEGRARHKHMADHFSLPEAEDAVFTLRQMSELPYQQTMGAGDDWDPLFGTLTNFRFLEQKAATGAVETTGEGAVKTYTGIFAIRDDYSLALQSMPGGDSDSGGRTIIVTATDLGKGAGYQVRCPFCNQYSDLEEGWLGTVQLCPRDGCGKPLKVNPFKVPPGNT